jgi:hypothetical protein
MFSGCVCKRDSAGTVTCKCDGLCNCAKGVVEMSSQVTAVEKQIIFGLGTTESAFIAARDRRARERSDPSAVTGVAQDVCQGLGISESKFAIEAANRRVGRPLVMSAGSQTGAGLIGPVVVDEAYSEYRTELEQPSVDHLALVREAEKSISEYLAAADAPDGWKLLAHAAAKLAGALDRIAPPFVDRTAGGRNTNQWK